MTIKLTTKDSNGNPIPGVLASACVLETGQMFQRSSDGSGYSDIALESVPSAGKSILLSIVKEGYAVYTQYLTITTADQVVSATLIPF